MKPPRILLLPGWQDSGAGHWQTLWEQGQGHQRVQQADWLWPRRGDWMMQLEETLLADERPALLAAHSLGCHLVAAWAAHSQHTRRVLGALLVAPPDLERADLPPQVLAWAPIQRRPLPFASIAVLSQDDPCSAPARSLQLAANWGSRIVTLGRAGHINAHSGLGGWPEGLALLHALAHRAGLA